VGAWVFLRLSDWHSDQAKNMPTFRPDESCDMESSAGCVRHDYRMSWIVLWLMIGTTIALAAWWNRRHPSENALEHPASAARPG
jgi:hypothetical protein